MLKNKNREKGSITIEATLTLTLFMFAFIAIISLALIARVECITQYAIDQTAKEISQYCYIADRAGFLKKNNSNTTDVYGAKLDSTDEVIESLISFQQLTSSHIEETGKSIKSGDLDGAFDNVNDTVGDVKTHGNELYGKVKALGGDNPIAAVKTLATAMARETGKNVVSRVVAIPLCKLLVPKYVTNTTNGDADAMLKHLGVQDGLEGLNFGMSSILKDGRTVNIVCIYKVKVNWFFGGDKYLNVKQTASTAAWIKTTSLEEAATVPAGTSKWESGDYGSAFVKQVKAESGEDAIKSGKGIDLYDQEHNTYTEVHAINVFSKSYSSHTGEGKDASEYTLDKKKIRSAVGSYARKEKENIEKVNKSGNMLNRDTGGTVQTNRDNPKAKLVIYVPVEAKDKSENKKALDEVTKEIKEQEGVEVEIRYEDKAFTDSNA